MNKIWQIIKTEFKIEFAYPLTWVFFLVLPIVFTMAIGAALGGTNTSNDSDEPVDYRQLLLVEDQDDTELSDTLISFLENGNTVHVNRLAATDEKSIAQNEDARGYLTIPKGFEAAIQNNQPVTLILQVASDSFVSVAIENEIRSAFDHVNAAVMAMRSSLLIQQQGNTGAEQSNQSYSSDEIQQALTLLTEQPMFDLKIEGATIAQEASQGMNGFNQSSSGQLVTWSLITLLGGSIIFVRDRNEGSYQRMFSTPTPKAIYFIGKVLARMLMGLAQMVILVFFGMYVLKVDWGNNPLLLLAFLTCFSLTGTSLGLMLGSFCKTVKQADNLTTLISMLMAALGGAWWPLEITPTSYQTVVRAIPTTWAMMGFNDIIIKNQGFSGILLEGSVLLGFTFLFATIGILRLQKKE
jgi:ABC-2 type transport system permease protein